MARTTNEFGGGEIVPAIEAITGIQAPVMADFEAVPFGTVNHEHGERRQIQNLRNNLKSSSGIERIPFNGIDELDTEQGPAGQVVYALNTGDSRIRFINGTQNWRPFTSTNSTGTQPGTAIQVGPITNTSTEIMGSIEITFFGTNLNLLSAIDTISNNWMASIDGGAFAQVSPNFNSAAQWYTPEQFDEDLNRKIKPNNVTPIASFTTPGVHTVLIRFQNHGRDPATFGQAAGILFGCEIVNANTGITQQPGADFDGRVSALGGTTFPIEPNNTTVPSVNGRNTTGTAATYGTHSTGARVLNYLTSGGQYKQSFNLADENQPAAGSSFTTYTIQIASGGSSSVTIPATATAFTARAFGAGGSGGGSTIAGSIGQVQSVSGGGGGGGGQGSAAFSRATTGTSETLTLSIPGTTTGGALATAGNMGGSCTITAATGTTVVCTGAGGNPGGGGIAGQSGGGGGGAGAGSSVDLTGWTRADASVTGGGGTNGTINGSSSSPFLTSANGGSGGAVGGFGNTPLTGSEGAGGATHTQPSSGASGNAGNPGFVPGGGGSGAGARSIAFMFGFNNIFTGAGGTGAAGRVHIIISDPNSNLTETSFGIAGGELISTDTVTGIVEGSATATFGNAAFDTHRLNQQVIRRINFREFGANNQFATLSSSTNAAFTLDDGTTTLSGNGVETTTRNDIDTMLTSGTTNFFTFTFVGTGLDIFEAGAPDGTTVGNGQPVSIDGLSVGNYIPATLPQVTPIVSGLAYGTHTVRFTLPSTGANINPNVVDFIIYGPKKPEIPTLDAGSLELSDYNIMADYAATVNTTPGNGLGKGVLRKPGVREILYQGAQASYTPSIDTNSLSGVDIDTLNGNNWIRYTFYGTGFDFRFQANTAATASQRRRLRIYIDQGFDPAGAAATPLALDGTDTIDGNTIGVAFYGTGTTAATLVNAAAANADNQNPSTTAVTNGELRINSTTDNNAGLVITNLPLGLHSVKIFQAATVSGNRYAPRAFDVITPIHINEDTLKVGSEGLNNLTIDPVVEEDEAVVLANLGEAKAWINFDITTSSTINSSHNISAVIRASDSTARYYFDKPFKDSNYVVISTIFDTNNSPAATVLEQRANYVAINASLSGNEKQYIVCFGELIDE